MLDRVKTYIAKGKLGHYNTEYAVSRVCICKRDCDAYTLVCVQLRVECELLCTVKCFVLLVITGVEGWVKNKMYL